MYASLDFNIQSRRQWWFIHSVILTQINNIHQPSSKLEHGIATEQRPHNVFVPLQKPNSDKGRTVFSGQDMQRRHQPGYDAKSIGF